MALARSVVHLKSLLCVDVIREIRGCHFLGDLDDLRSLDPLVRWYRFQGHLNLLF